jgi:hypothetical protein
MVGAVQTFGDLIHCHFVLKGKEVQPCGLILLCRLPFGIRIYTRLCQRAYSRTRGTLSTYPTSGVTGRRTSGRKRCCHFVLLRKEFRLSAVYCL